MIARNRHRIWLRIGGLALLCLALIVALMMLKPPKVLPLPQPKESLEAVFQTDIENIRSFTVYPLNYPAYTLVQLDGHFAVEGQPDYPLKETDITFMAEHVAAVTPTERVDEWIDTPLNRANFGFADNTVHVTAQLKDGRSIGFQFGADAPTETPSVYFLLDQDPYLYTMPASVRDLFDQGLHFLHTVPDISTADTSDILAISVSTSERSVRLLSVGTTWALTEPMPYPASSDAMQRLLSTVQQLRLAVFVTDIDDQTNLSSYGLAQDTTTITTKRRDQASLVLELGADIHGIGAYCAYEGAIYMMSYSALGALHYLDVQSVAFQGVTDISFADVKHVEIRTPELSRKYSVQWVERVAPNNQLVLDENGQVQMDAKIMLEGTAVDADALTKFYQRLEAMQPAKPLSLDIDLPPTPKLTISVYTKEDSRILSFYAMDDGTMALSMDGHVVWAYEGQAVEQALKMLLDS
jgi:hypothetical protein